MVVTVTLRQLSFLIGRDFFSHQLMCLMFAGLKRGAPEHAVGMELEEPFLTPLELNQPTKDKPDSPQQY